MPSAPVSVMPLDLTNLTPALAELAAKTISRKKAKTLFIRIKFDLQQINGSR
jgi:hypothetical protein